MSWEIVSRCIFVATAWEDGVNIKNWRNFIRLAFVSVPVLVVLMSPVDAQAVGSGSGTVLADKTVKSEGYGLLAQSENRSGQRNTGVSNRYGQHKKARNNTIRSKWPTSSQEAPVTPTKDGVRKARPGKRGVRWQPPQGR